MGHKTEIVSYNKLSNGQFAYCIRCCGDPSTDHWHTMGINVPDRTASLNVARKYVSDQHAKMQEVEQEAVTLAGDVQEHG